MLSQIFVFQPQLIRNLIVCSAGNANTSRLRQRLHPGCYVDTIAVYSAILFDDITEVDMGINMAQLNDILKQQNHIFLIQE